MDSKYRYKNQKIITFVFILLFIINATASGERKDIKYKAILTNSLNKLIQVSEFNCENKIILYFSWFDLKGDYSLKVNWYRPDGKLQETTKSSFTVKNSRKLNTLVSLKLIKGKERGFIFSETGWFDFIGQWFVEIFLDEEFLEKKIFQVIC